MLDIIATMLLHHIYIKSATSTTQYNTVVKILAVFNIIRILNFEIHYRVSPGVMATNQ